MENVPINVSKNVFKTTKMQKKLYLFNSNTIIIKTMSLVVSFCTFVMMSLLLHDGVYTFNGALWQDELCLPQVNPSWCHLNTITKLVRLISFNLGIFH
jgi:hypothetical protein